MRTITENKRKALLNLTNDQGIISALAIDQRGALKKMMGENGTQEAIEEFKMLVSEILTPYASSILLDPEYGLPATKKEIQVQVYYLPMKKQGMMRQNLADSRIFYRYGLPVG